MRREEEEIFHTLKVGKKEALAYVSLAKQKQETPTTYNILDRLGDKARENVINNVKEAVLSKELEVNPLAETFPESPPSEPEICRLVIIGKSLN